MISEVILPSISNVGSMFDDGKIGTAEENLLRNIILDSIRILENSSASTDEEPTKNIVILAADADSQLASYAASSAYRSENWNVFSLGDMSSAADVLFDLDLQKMLTRIWKKKTGIMIILVFSSSEEGLHFFADSINTVKEKAGKKVFSILCGPVDKKTHLNADLIANDLDTVLQWSETVFESHTNKR